MHSAIRKLLFVGFFTGIGHLLSISLIPYIGVVKGAESASILAKIDSTFTLIVAILSFGITLTVTRDIALDKENWKQLAYRSLNARFTLALVLFFIVVTLYFIGLVNKTMLYCFMLSPLIALNLDFLLYGKGMPEKAATLSFFRLATPIFLLWFGTFFFDIAVEYFIFFMGVGIVCTAVLVMKSLDLRFNINIKISSLDLYFFSLLVGLPSFLVVFQRYSFISFMKMSDQEMLVVASLLKLYLAFVAIRRLFIQTFYTQLRVEKVYRAIEIFVFLLGVFVFSFVIYKKEFVFGLIFPDVQASNAYYLTSFAYLVLFSSLFATADSRLLLDKKDRGFVGACVCSFISWMGFQFTAVLTSDVILNVAFAELILVLTYRYNLRK
jgi:O-antigen/teichoic acid export membrane protein